MPRFPTKQTEVLVLAKQMRAGYLAHPGDFPNVNVGMLNVRINHFINMKKSWSQDVAAQRLATEKKQASFKRLKEIMKQCLTKSEVDVASDPAKLALIGWEPAKMSQPVERPGQPDNLVSVSQGRDNVTLKWDGPAYGGAVRNYIIQRRCQKADGKFDSWKLIETSIQNKITLTNQPLRKTLEYRVKAINISGEGLPSNVIAVVL